VEETVENRLAQRRIRHGGVPGIDGQLAHDHGRTPLRPVFDHLQEFPAGLCGSRGDQEVVEDDELSG